MGSLADRSGTRFAYQTFVGTAAVISPVDRIGYLGQDIHIPTGSDGMGPVSRPIWKQLVGIQTGKIEHPWSVLVE